MVQLTVHLLNHGTLGSYFFLLHLEHKGIMAVYQRTLQPVLPFKRLPGENIHGQFNDQVSAGRIEVGGGKDAVNHILEAGIGQCVHAKERNVFRLSQSPAGAQRHAVVLAKDGIRANALPHQVQHHIIAIFFQPVAIGRCQKLHSRILGQCLNKTFVPVIGRRRARQSLDFHNTSLPIHDIGHKISHDAANLHVVGPDEGRVLVGINLAVEEDDRNAGVERIFHSMCDGGGLVGRHHQEVHSFFHERPDLLHLALAVVIGRHKTDLHAIGAGRQLEFLVQFGTPDVIAALGNAYNQ